MVGIWNAALSEKFQLNSELTLESVITQVRQSEAVKEQQPLLRSGSGSTDTLVGAVNKRNPRGWERQNIGYQSKSGPTSPICGRQPVRDNHNSPARDAIYRKCHKRGHFQYICRSSTNVSSITTNTREESDVFLESEDNPWEVTLQANQ